MPELYEFYVKKTRIGQPTPEGEISHLTVNDLRWHPNETVKTVSLLTSSDFNDGHRKFTAANMVIFTIGDTCAILKNRWGSTGIINSNIRVDILNPSNVK